MAERCVAARRWRRAVLTTASAGLALAGLAATAPEVRAQAGARGESPGVQRRSAIPFPAAMRLTPSARESLRRWLCPNGGSPVPGAPGRCDGLRRDAQAAVAPPAGTVTSDAAGWFRGLPPARGRQVACPEGFKATLARGHADVTRCMPG